MSETLSEELIRHEGLKLSMYDCPAGYKTIGVGHNLEAKPISKRAAMVILEDDIDDCMTDLDNAFPWWHQLHDDAGDVLLNMCFNLGISRLSGFSRMWAALQIRDYAAAAIEMEDSRWAEQVGRRAKELAQKMRNCA